MEKSIVTTVFLLLTVLFWGVAPIFDKAALRQSDPLAGTMLRGIVVGVTMVLALVLTGKTRELASMPRQAALYFVLSGLLAGALGVFTYFRALQLAPTSKIVPLAATYPLITAFLSVLLLGETVTPARAAGVVLIIAGVWLVK